MVFMIVYFFAGVAFLFIAAFVLSGVAVHPAAILIGKIVLYAFGLLMFLLAAQPLLKKLPKRVRTAIDQDFEPPEVEHAIHALALCLIRDKRLVQFQVTDALFHIPTQLITDIGHKQSALAAFAASFGLALPDIELDVDYRAVEPVTGQLVTYHTYRTFKLPALSAKQKLISMADLTTISPLEKQIVTRYHKEGIVD